MIIDACSLPDGMVVKADICIVGAGVAGLVLAREFRGGGMRVALLESGGLQPDRATQSLYWGENVGHPYFPLDVTRASGIGGSSNRWSVPIGGEDLGVRLRALDGIDFEERKWVPYSGWPFGKSHLDPFYERAHAVCQIGPYKYDVCDWVEPGDGCELPFASDRVRTTVFQFGRRDVFIGQFKKELEESENITVYTHSNAMEVETNPSSNAATGIRFACFGGKSFRVSAKLFVLAMGAIETPRILLLSDKVYKSGIGNQNGLVGRFFMEHIHLWSGTLIPALPGFVKLTTFYRMHESRGIPVMGKLTLSEDVLRGEELLNYCVSIHPCALRGRHNVSPPWRVVSWPLVSGGQSWRLRDEAAALPGGAGIGNISASTAVPYVMPRRALARQGISNANVAGAPQPATLRLFRRGGRAIRRLLNSDGRIVFKLNHMTEQAPNPESRVTLSDERDALGRRRAKLDWRLSPIDVRSIGRAQEILDIELRSAGLGRIEMELDENTPPSRFEGGWHHMGTTRMHEDPRRGVVDSNCRVHGFSNLFIAGPSVFPTGGYANPVLTIAALSLRLADHLKGLGLR